MGGSVKLNKTQLLKKIGVLFGQIYWHERGTFPKETILAIRREHRALEFKFELGDYVPETNSRGNIIERSFDGQTDRYAFDMGRCSRANGWIQYDTQQDASYFGVWVNMETRQTVTFCEGDIIEVTCLDKASFKAELDDAAQFYGPPPPAMVTYDKNWNRTEYFSERPAL
ncbi:MAG: hypothetical protein JEZ11_03850 [Desulfobacterales bacterium]|nr:hypothetical protein [Desulfobacterales bacterium]